MIESLAMQANRMRITALMTAVALTSCAVDRGTYYCYVTSKGELCETQTPLPAVADRHDIAVPPDGPCQLDGKDVSCGDLGRILRRAYPSTNPQLFICPSRQTTLARLNVADAPLGDERLFCVQEGCASKTTVTEACRSLLRLSAQP